LFQALTAPLGPFEFPPVDAGLYWALAIVPGCLRWIRRKKIDVIYTTSFPYSDHVAGYLLKKLSGKPWVADFRDPWTQHAGNRNSGWRYRVDQWVEQRVLYSADRVIGVTPAYTQELRDLALKRSVEIFSTIENGYDQADLTSEPSINHRAVEPNKPIEMAHVGYVYDGTILPFLHALDQLGNLGSRFCCRFVGGIAPKERQWLASHPLAVDLRIEPRQPHAQAIQIMQSVDIVLLLLGVNPGWVGNYPGKLFEYMASGTPILLVGPCGVSAELIVRSGTGCFLPVDDPQAIVAGLRMLAEQPETFRQRFYHPVPEVIAAYERKALTRKLADLFETVIH
jgi:glycosyltransferase involved in cell wall biosynthesis